MIIWGVCYIKEPTWCTNSHSIGKVKGCSIDDMFWDFPFCYPTYYWPYRTKCIAKLGRDKVPLWIAIFSFGSTSASSVNDPLPQMDPMCIAASATSATESPTSIPCIPLANTPETH